MKEKADKINSLLKNSQSVLILPMTDSTGDFFLTALFTHLYLQKYNKKSYLVFDNQTLQNISFLKPEQYLTKIDQLPGQEIQIKLKTDTNKLAEIWYEQKDDQTVIYLSSKTGFVFDPENFKTEISQKQIDLIILIGADSLDVLGEVYTKNKNLFKKANIVSLAAKNSEASIELKKDDWSAAQTIVTVLSEDFSNLQPELMTIFLLAVYLKTNSFKNSFTNKDLLDLAAKALEAGANHQEIVKNIYKTNSFYFLKKLGEIFTNTEYYSKSNWTVSHLQKNGLSESDLLKLFQALEDLVLYKNILIITKKDNQTESYIKISSDKKDLATKSGFVHWLNGFYKKINNEEIEIELKKIKEDLLIG